MKTKFFVTLALVLIGRAAFAASGMFPKMPAVTNVYVVSCLKSSGAARMTAYALQGLINQTSAEVYVISSGEHQEQLKFSKKPFEKLTPLTGDNAGLRTLFQKYQERVKKMFVYDPKENWTWPLALMAAAQQNGIPVTEAVQKELISEFGWKGEVEDFRDKWTNRIEAYDWALTNLMPHCSKQVVFWVQMDKPLIDYIMASKGFDFSLDAKNPYERAEVEKIFRAKGYGAGTSLMGYAGDNANELANPCGIGYVVSDFYHNGSFWSSFPNKTYTQAPGKAMAAQPGKVYVSFMWSDGDNIQFDQNALFEFWHDPYRGTIPVATPLSPTLQELNSPLLDWYYSKMTTNDELVAGPTGVQFIYIRNFRDDLFSTWCELTREWCGDAGFHSGRIWRANNPSAKYSIYMKMCGFTGLFGEGRVIKAGLPLKLDTFSAWTEDKLFEQFTTQAKPNSREPVFINCTPIVQGFDKPGGKYAAIRRLMDRLETAHPDRYVFLLPKDQFATVRAYYHLPAN